MFGVFVFDNRGKCRHAHADGLSAVCSLPEGAIGKRAQDLFPKEVAVRLSRQFKKVAASGQPATISCEFGAKGQIRFLEIQLLRIADDKIVCVVVDVTEKKQLEADVHEMSRRLAGIRDEERRQIALDLHDNAAQNLVALVINLEHLRCGDSALSAAQVKALAECQRLCERSMQQVRSLLYLLHAPAPDRLHIPALKAYVDGFAKRSGIEVTLELDPAIDNLPKQLEADLFRVVQEALQHALRHARRHSIKMLVEAKDRHVELQLDLDMKPANVAVAGAEGQRFATVAVRTKTSEKSS